MSRKKRKDDSTSNDSDSDLPIDMEVQVEFEARQPEADDFHGIKRLLNQLFSSSPVNVGELTDLVLSQENVGSVIKIRQSEGDSDDESDDEDNVFGLTTVINTRLHKDKGCVKEIIKLIETKCSDGEVHSKLTALLHGNDDGDTGLLLSERFLNIPPQIALPSYKNLLDDIDRAKDASFNFRYFIIICKSYKEPDVRRPKKGKKKKRGGQSGAAAHRIDSTNSDIKFCNAEEEILSKMATMSFSYAVDDKTSVRADDDDDDEDSLIPIRTVLVIPRDTMPRIIHQMEELLQ
ncbi:BRCA2 and CDKN1A-interacting protein-like [Oscarella lobularis]|uniref:BRCA2 and CDKN1A-interacting protein-like n=1 Tax=Oscarella lobularis TaxID=121494 RepID=UPI0033143A40